ncbi:MAG: hypothetical protein KKC84_06445 [Candidatus Omnitrophica bacterium]|nr:hypothetical protein [Candidatus Omnitrophota bacterium]
MKLDYGSKNLRSFGFTMGIACAVITVLIFFRHRHSLVPTSILCLSFLTAAWAVPQWLRPLYYLWMRLALVLNWVSTRVILSLLFYGIFTCIAVLLKIFRKDLLDRGIQKEATTYWRRKEQPVGTPQDYQRQF